MVLPIPAQVLSLMRVLEDRGYQAWAVGGCIRDSLLGIEPHDWDLCTNARPQETAAVFSGFQLIRAGEKHGTIAVITDRQPVEITTFRTEGDYADNRHPGWVRFEDTIESDLSRRDFTVNAMAYSPHRGLADPFGGQRDLENRVLRAVGHPEQRFREDGLRILRGARFAARFALTPEEKTLSAMDGLADALLPLQARERVFMELCGFLPKASVQDLLTFAPVLKGAIPQLGPMMGFAQHNPHHIYDVFTHTAHVVAGTPPELAVRFAALLHDVAKPRCFAWGDDGFGHFKGHAHVGAEMAHEVLTELKAPKALREEVSTLVRYHGITRDLGQQPEDKALRRLLRKLGARTMRNLLALDRADDGGKGTAKESGPFDRFQERLEQILVEKPCLSLGDLAISGRDLMEMGIPPGPEMGRCLNRLLEEVVDGTTKNHRESLLNRVRAEKGE